jgi:hypothetical protein
MPQVPNFKTRSWSKPQQNEANAVMKKTNDDWFVYRLGKPRRKLLGEVKGTDRETALAMAYQEFNVDGVNCEESKSRRSTLAKQAAAKDHFERFEALANA